MVGGSPSDVRNLQFPVGKRLGDGYIDSPVAAVTPLIEGPRGELLLQGEALEPAISVAAGDGFASARRLVEHAIAIDGTVGMHFFRVDTASPGSRLGNLCRAWGDVLDGFVYRCLEPDVSMVDVLKAVADSCGNPAKKHAGESDRVRRGPVQAVSDSPVVPAGGAAVSRKPLSAPA